MTSFFRIANKRASYPFGIISLAHAPVNVTDLSIGSIKLVSNTISISDDVRVSKVTSGIGTANPSRASEFTPVFSVVRIGQSLASYVVLC
jgi:hypothetical protein